MTLRKREDNEDWNGTHWVARYGKFVKKILRTTELINYWWCLRVTKYEGKTIIKCYCIIIIIIIITITPGVA